MKSLAIALLLLLIYQSIIWAGLIPPGLGRDTHEKNMIRAESWHYRKELPPVLLVGSSKTNFLNYDVLGKDVAHFGFGGRGCLTGLEILHGSKELPKLILIEIGDTLQYPADTECVKAATTNGPADILSCLQHRFQPYALLYSAINSICPQEAPAPAATREMIQVQANGLDISMREAEREAIVEHINTAQKLIAELQSRGASVALFDAPVEKEVSQSLWVTEATTLVNSYFDQTPYEKLPTPAGAWHTRDGTHLDADSSKRYSLWLREKIDKLRAQI